MTDYTVRLTELHEKYLDHLRGKDGGPLTREQFVEMYVIRGLENHGLTIKDNTLEAAASMSDEDFAALPAKRQAIIDARKAEQEARETKDVEIELQPANPR